MHELTFTPCQWTKQPDEWAEFAHNLYEFIWYFWFLPNRTPADWKDSVRFISALVFPPDFVFIFTFNGWGFKSKTHIADRMWARSGNNSTVFRMACHNCPGCGWFMCCWLMHRPPLENHLWATNGSSFFVITGLTEARTGPDTFFYVDKYNIKVIITNMCSFK